MDHDNTCRRIRKLNDAFRATFTGGRVLLTEGVSSLPNELIHRLLDKVRSFDSFKPGNDPYGEHDFGAIDMDGTRFFWKIDYYDRSPTAGSENPADPAITTRVLTIMRADEY